MDWKPRICWQVPLFFAIEAKTETTTVRASRAVDSGGEGILDWWCTEHPDPFNADQPVYVTMEAELRRVCGDHIYHELAAYCQARQTRGSRKLTLLPMIP
jgi:hypothetical protein